MWDENDPDLSSSTVSRLQARDDFAKKWFGGSYDPGHTQQMREVLNQLDNAKRDIQRYCKCP